MFLQNNVHALVLLLPTLHVAMLLYIVPCFLLHVMLYNCVLLGLALAHSASCTAWCSVLCPATVVPATATMAFSQNM